MASIPIQVLRDRRMLMAGAVAVVLLVLYIPVFAHAVDVWTSDQEFSFGFLIPPIAVGLVWLRRAAVRRALGQGSSLGLVPFIGGLLMLVVSARINVHTLAGASFAVTIFGAMMYLYGQAAARATMFPSVFLTMILLLYSGLLGSVGFFLQGVTAKYSALAASAIGVPVRRVGVDLFAGHFHFVVAEACSGMSSLLALLCIGMLFISFTTASLQRRLILFALIVPIVLAANIIRVTLVVVLAQVFGSVVVEGFIHSMFSLTLFTAALGLFFIAGSALRCLPRIAAIA